MNDSEYAQLVEQTLTAIEQAVEQAIDQSDASLDFENTGGVLTIFCEDSNTQVIVSRQAPMQQIWVAAKSGGYHCGREGEAWYCTTTQEPLPALLSRVCSEQSHEAVELEF